jgi:stage II sporulation protein D
MALGFAPVRITLLFVVSGAAVLAPWRASRLAGVGQGPSQRPVRVLVASGSSQLLVSSSEGWQVTDESRRAVASATNAGELSIERAGRSLRVVHAGVATPWTDGALAIESSSAGVLGIGRRSYRGVLDVSAADTAIIVVNRIDVEEYLRGVVPLEVGARIAEEHAAVEAQAVAARSYTYTRMLASSARAWDLTATEADQVYGGVGVETFWGDLAVSATAGWYLSVGGRPVGAPYHAICGGQTAAPSEVWRGGSDAFLRAVSDLDPRTGRPWCAIAPRFAWRRQLDTAALSLLGRRLADARGGAAGFTAVRGLRIDGLTPGARVRALAVDTDGGTITLPGNDIRFALRSASGEILPSTWFSLESRRAPDGTLVVHIDGRGNGHGVGMCQWGAMGRARAGHDFRAILRAYYPGAELRRAS